MKYINKLLLLSFIFFNFVEAAENDNTKKLEEEYDQCIQKAADALIQEAADKTIMGKLRGRAYQYSIGNGFGGGINSFDKFIHARYNKQCNKCLVDYALKSVFAFLKKK